MSAFERLVGPTLLRKSAAGTESVSTAEALGGKIVLIYFSAHWCPPCRRFTPMLVQSYNQMKAAGKNLEIVFASADNSESQFNEYYAEMPWLAVPFEERDVKENLSREFGVRGIPMLVVLDEDGQVITKGAAATS